MRKAVLFIFFIIVCALAGVVIANARVTQSFIATQAPIDTPTPIPTVATPTTLIIPTLHIHAPIESVGMDSMGRMDIPKVVTDTAWYNLGVKPGEMGNAVIDGHFDKVTGAPSVFYYLKTLQKGDSVEVVDTNGQTYVFTVQQTVNYPTNTFPLDTVFGPSDEKNLNLITCSGTWDKTRHNYSERTVVFAKLQE